MSGLTWDQVRAFLEAFGMVKGLFTIFFVWAHTQIFLLYRGRLKDRQKQIDMLAEENREYREKFTFLLDREFQYKTPAALDKRKRQLERHNRGK